MPRQPTKGLYLVEGGQNKDFVDAIEELSSQSVSKRYAAYEDIDWNDPNFKIDPADPRWQLDERDALGASSWYKSQDPGQRSELGLSTVVRGMKACMFVEGILSEGLLEFAMALPNRSSEFRYAYHEVIELSQHSLTFHEFIKRSGLDPSPSFPRWMTWIRYVLERRKLNRIIRMGRTFPEQFFVYVIGFKAPFHADETRMLESRAGGQGPHPLLERMVRSHIGDQARHLSFAYNLLEHRIPLLDDSQKSVLEKETPHILAKIIRRMWEPSADQIRRYKIPGSVIRQAFRNNPIHKQRIIECLGPLQGLYQRLGLLNAGSAKRWARLGVGPRP